MEIDKLWDDYELFFYHEFINDSDFPASKKEVLQKDLGCFFINKDFTIYQEKSRPFEQINETDYQNNLGTFIVILYNLPVHKVKDFISFHYEKYNGRKQKFLDYLYHELKDSRYTQGGKELPPLEQKLITMEWCAMKLKDITSSDSINQNSYKTEIKKAETVIINNDSKIKNQSIGSEKEQKESIWNKTNVIIALVVGLATIVGIVWQIIKG
ncbi:hypothetical protein [Tenacibaculum maritimum]|uniref:hypothetical protein n=1 Tax=Tenacibaculum maritimum TaxID=107401 RepID=UPI0012E69242|nr:hypothetical protein [Tenacibaculum maritimum]CAA0233737.1 hypothetical protein DPIF8902391_50009 [Tenacibaculum maritimum]